ncbi:DUF3052 domain-containing protein [Streptomyces lavendulae]
MTTEERISPAARLGFEPGMLVQEIGHDHDADQELRQAIEEFTGKALADGDHEAGAGAVLLWFRDDDGDLTDSLVDAIGALEPAGVIWLLTPKAGRDGYIEPGDIAEAAQTAGLTQTRAISVATDWAGTRLVSPAR